MKKFKYSLAFTIYASIIVCVLIAVFATSNSTIDVAQDLEDYQDNTEQVDNNVSQTKDSLDIEIK
jgi:hypothetical protein